MIIREMISLLHPHKCPSWQRSSQPREPLYLREIKAGIWKHLNTFRHTWNFKKMCLRGNFNSTERYLLSLMFLIEPIWTRQPASQLAAPLGFFSDCGLHSSGTFDNDVRPSEPRQPSLFISSNLLVIGLDGSGRSRTRTVSPHESGDRFKDQNHFVCPSLCAAQNSLLIHPIIDSKTSIAVAPLNVVTFQHRFQKPKSRLLKVTKAALRAEAQAAFPQRSALLSPSLVVASPSPHLLALLCFPGTLSDWAAGNPPPTPPRLLKGILHRHSAAISAGHAIRCRMPTTSLQSFMRLQNDQKEGKSLTERSFFFSLLAGWRGVSVD